MLSNGISSRLQQLQQHKDSAGAEEPPRVTAEYASMGYRRQGLQAKIPARKGLAADLINKFNQMSSPAIPSSGAATVERGAAPAERATSAAATATASGDIQAICVLPPRPASSSSTPVSSQKYPQPQPPQQAASEDPNSTATRCSNSAVGPAADAQPAEAQLPRVCALDGRSVEDVQAQDRAQSSSPFLTDTELDRALFEIQEFSRDMNISLFGDDSDEL
ncbi:hypothetical protein GGI25_003928 [Coemansia spiralis]|uniref:Uncharacterized protein n=2 Tax=Coemansia TaxID=4863 RepID=A0A9W8G746_9FUNG|nr:hypothetical protein BX070DRAFT_229759 [Coemansia spiralis]KAJ1988983.1 hypothetical protein EDC05_004964 [Coemansia umbellata]KAJ2620939.1 hypothetical protein GGI26_004545 [Coemansia sp. RSA 1358]KAJ2675511.1 hypothetical protein GGI25_003928 [Coemansia spiralis]